MHSIFGKFKLYDAYEVMPAMLGRPLAAVELDKGGSLEAAGTEPPRG